MEDFVTFEIAKKLKEKGFPQVTFGNYNMQSACYIEDGRFYENGCITEVSRAYTAPTISQVLKWLRKEKKLHVHPELAYFSKVGLWEVYIVNINDYVQCSTNKEYSSYEEAALAGIEYVLDNLI